MAKPIFVIRVERPIWEGSHAKEFHEDLSNHMKDYHILTIPNSKDPEHTDFEVFNADDIDPIEIEDLKKKVLEQIDDRKKTKKD